MKRFGVAILWIIGVYFVARAVAEPFVIDLNDPATYRHDWGGPSLTGVLLVHCGLGLVAAALMAWRLMRRSSVRLRRGVGRSPAAPRHPREPDSHKEPGPRSMPTRRSVAKPRSLPQPISGSVPEPGSSPQTVSDRRSVRVGA